MPQRNPLPIDPRECYLELLLRLQERCTERQESFPGTMSVLLSRELGLSLPAQWSLKGGRPREKRIR